MCILFIFTDPAPKKEGYRLIIASNRDEFYKRPAKAAGKCCKTGVIGGRDMENGRENGMWLGISLNETSDYKFRFGALLNVTGEDRKSGVKGRGFIVNDYLANNILASEYINQLQNTKESYNAFNFVALEISLKDITTYHNSNTPTECTKYEGKQILGFGNSTVKAPLGKVIKGRERFQEIIVNNNNTAKKDSLKTELIELLKWTKKHLPDAELERRAPTTFEKLSSVYVKFIEAGYGTRTHSLILVDYDWNIEFVESTMTEPIDPYNPVWNTVSIAAHL